MTIIKFKTKEELTLKEMTEKIESHCHLFKSNKADKDNIILLQAKTKK